MNHKIVSAVVSLLTLLLVAAGVIFAVTVRAASLPTGADAAGSRSSLIPAILHPIDGDMADCARCHNQDDDSLPANHASYSAATCQTCHPPAITTVAVAVLPTAEPASQAGSPAPTAAPESPEVTAAAGNAVPHPITDKYAECVKCHAIGSRRSMPDDHADYTNADCQDCHTVPAAADSGDPGATSGEGQAIPHPVTDIFTACDTCHAIGNVKLAMPANHASYANATCKKCHKLTE